MERNNTVINKIIETLFGIAIIICCIVMVYALIIFTKNCTYLSNTTDRLLEKYELGYTNVSSNEEVIETYKNMDDVSEKNDSEQTIYTKEFLDYTMKLQELESQSASTNILTFIYTFLSGTLIGVATYLTKKSADSVKQIKENKELITNLDSRNLFSNFYMYVQQTMSMIQIFCLSIDTAKNKDELINKYIPRLNELFNEFSKFAHSHRNNINILSRNDKKIIVDEINSIKSIIDDINVSKYNNPIISGTVKLNWQSDLDVVKKLMK